MMFQFVAEFLPPTNLSGILLCSLLGSLIIFVIPDSRIRLIRSPGLCASSITFSYFLVSRVQFDNLIAKYYFVETCRWLPYSNINLVLGIDGPPSFLVVSTMFLISICILVVWFGLISYHKKNLILHPMDNKPGQQIVRGLRQPSEALRRTPPGTCLRCGQPSRLILCQSCRTRISFNLELQREENPLKWMIRYFETNLPDLWAQVKETVRQYGLPPK